jgi:hypothetical protein
MLEESQVEGSKNQNHSYIYHQPFPQPASEKEKIDAEYGAAHHQHIEHENCRSSHLSPSQSKAPASFIEE